jgi:N-glycosylase/DNA lyase
LTCRQKSGLFFNMFQLRADNFSLRHTLSSGQTFCWQSLGTDPDSPWQGYIYDTPCQLRQAGNILHVKSSTALDEALVRRYFNLTETWSDMLLSLPADPWLDLARKKVAGLRCVHEPWWECTVNFICSSLKQIPQIEQINQNLRQRFGDPLPDGNHRFPTPEQLARVSEKDLRACKLGYRARHLHKAAQQVNASLIHWDQLQHLPLDQASLELQKLAGVGEKVAHCILLYAGNRLDAFPLDVWVFRLMHELYFPKKRKIPSRPALHKKSLQLFGSKRGIAQHYLFHWYRSHHGRHSPSSSPLTEASSTP